MSTATLPASKQSAAEEIVNNYIPWSMGAGLIPVPIADLAALTGIQVKMLSELSKHYGVEFSENRGKSIVLSLLGSLGATTLALGTVGSMVKGIPGIGTFLGAATLPVFGAAVTYAIGKVFIQHFESGGTFLNFDGMQAKKDFAETFEAGKKEATAIAKKVDAKISTTLDI